MHDASAGGIRELRWTDDERTDRVVELEILVNHVDLDARRTIQRHVNPGGLRSKARVQPVAITSKILGPYEARSDEQRRATLHVRLVDSSAAQPHAAAAHGMARTRVSIRLVFIAWLLLVSAPRQGAAPVPFEALMIEVFDAACHGKIGICPLFGDADDVEA